MINKIGMSLVEITVAMGLAAGLSLTVGTSMKMVHKSYKEITITNDIADFKTQLNQAIRSTNKCSSVIDFTGFNPILTTAQNISRVVLPSSIPVTITRGYKFPGSSGITVTAITYRKDVDAYSSMPGGGGSATFTVTTGIAPAPVTVTEYRPIIGSLDLTLHNSAAANRLVGGSPTVTVSFPVSVTMKRTPAGVNPWLIDACGASDQPLTSEAADGWLAGDKSDPSMCSAITLTVTKNYQTTVPSSFVGVRDCPVGMYAVSQNVWMTTSNIWYYPPVGSCSCSGSVKGATCGDLRCSTSCSPTGAITIHPEACGGYGCTSTHSCNGQWGPPVNITYNIVQECCKVRR